MKRRLRRIGSRFAQWLRSVGFYRSTRGQGRSGGTPSGIHQAVRAGFGEVARKRLRNRRARYLKLRSSAVREALNTLEGSACSSEVADEMVALLADTEADAVTEPLVRRAAAHKVPLAAVASYRVCLALRARQAQLTGVGPEWKLNDKLAGYRFIRQHGFDHPELLQRNVTVSALEQQERVVIKPVSGAASRGVYQVTGDGRVFEPKGERWLANWQEMIAAMQDDLAAGRVKRDRWMVERLVTEDDEGEQPGRDLKFYCFYGEVGRVLEVDRWQRKVYCEWDGEGKPLDTGRYSGKRFDGQGVTADELERVKALSREIPAPAIRIDFLRSAGAAYGMMFCEFTPRPGGFHLFDEETDRRMGEMYLEAEQRLVRDLLHGKRFPALFLDTNHRPDGRNWRDGLEEMSQ